MDWMRRELPRRSARESGRSIGRRYRRYLCTGRKGRELRARHEAVRAAGVVPAALLYSVRTREDLTYHEELAELARSDTRFGLRITLTREVAPGWSRAVERIDASAV